MVAPITPLGSNHASLRTWAAYSARNTAELHSAPQPVTPPSISAASGTLESVSKVVKLETTATLEVAHHSVATLETSAGPQVMTCRCSLCSNVGLNTIASPLGGKVIPINLTGALSEDESAMVEELRQRDAEVRRHEQSHIMTAGAHALGSAQYTYQVGPDGKRYAVGGEVQVDMSEVPDDPEATLRKAQQLQAAALAPSDPSGADRSVAMAAARMATEARHEIMKEQTEKIAAKPGKSPQEEKSKEVGQKVEDGNTSIETQPFNAAGTVSAHTYSEGQTAAESSYASQSDIAPVQHGLDLYA